MERRRSWGNAAGGSLPRRRLDASDFVWPAGTGGNAVSYPGNPHFRPHCAFKTMAASAEMERRRQHLSEHAVVITDEGPLAVQSREEVKDLIQLHLGIRKHEFMILRSNPEPYVAIFHDPRARDVAFTAARLVEGPFELRFHAWDIDRFGERENIPYHVRLCLEGIPHHAWFTEVAAKILGDEAIIQHIEEGTLKWAQHKTYDVWALCKEPSRIPQMVFLSLAKHDPKLTHDAQVHVTRPRGVKSIHVFKILIDLDAVEDLLFYHYPRDN
jgi:hypothetical protein